MPETKSLSGLSGPEWWEVGVIRNQTGIDHLVIIEWRWEQTFLKGEEGKVGKKVGSFRLRTAEFSTERRGRRGVFLTGASFVSLCKPSLLPAFRICPVSAPEFKFYTNHWRKTCKKTVFNVVLLAFVGTCPRSSFCP